MARVSVIIPAFNCAPYLSQTIDSILGQDWGDVELIVVDDGSTDATPDVAASYGSRLRLLTQKNSGVCMARNRGIDEATGEFICLMDHDDFWFPWKLSRQMAAFSKFPTAGVVFSSFTLWHRGSDGDFRTPDEMVSDLEPDGIDAGYTGWIYHLLLLDCWILTSTAMLRREVFDRCGRFDPDLPYSEDWDLWLRVSREFEFVKLQRPTTLYRQHPQQGNRLARLIDYRTELLRTAVARWGYCSPDGRCLDERRFRQQLAKYHADFAFGQVRGGNLALAVRSLANAWAQDPRNLKYLGYIPATLLGWRPSW